MTMRQMIGQPGYSFGAPRYSYNPNDVRGGFDADGRSLVYNPRYYDPNKAAQVLINGAIFMGPGICKIASEVESFAMWARMSDTQLKAITRGSQPKILGDFFTAGVSVRPAGLTDEAAGAYREVARRIVSEYEISGNLQGAATQLERLKLLSHIMP